MPSLTNILNSRVSSSAGLQDFSRGSRVPGMFKRTRAWQTKISIVIQVAFSFGPGHAEFLVGTEVTVKDMSFGSF